MSSRIISSRSSNNSVTDLLQNAEFDYCWNNSSSMNTGFGGNNSLHYSKSCGSSSIKTPLYLENYLAEFKSEEEKAAVRKALGIYNRNDVVAMSLLTAEEGKPSQQDWNNAVSKQLKQGDVFFTPVTSFKSVFDSEGVTLDIKLKEINTLVVEQQKSLNQIIQVSKSETISSLGDVKAFLQGFNNGDTLRKTLDDINQDMLRFEKTGQITS